MQQATGRLLATDRGRAGTDHRWILGQLAWSRVTEAMQLTDRHHHAVAIMGDGTRVQHRIAKVREFKTTLGSPCLK